MAQDQAPTPPRSKGRLTSIIALAPIALAAFWGLTASRFVPSVLGQAAAAGGAAVLGLACAALGYALGPVRNTSAFGRPITVRTAAERAIALGLAGAVMGFLAIQGPVLEVWTATTGSPGRMVVHVSDYQARSRTGCRGLNFRETPLLARRGLCVSFPGRSQAPQPGSAVALTGEASPFGIEPQSFQVLDGRPA